MMDKSLGGKVAIVGVADTEVGVLPGRTPMEMGVEAALAAIATTTTSAMPVAMAQAA